MKKVSGQRIKHIGLQNSRFFFFSKSVKKSLKRMNPFASLKSELIV